jgi:23S rRNA pseudouridine1911/1915/1917 synthase
MERENVTFVADNAIRLDLFLTEKLSQTRNQVVQLIEQNAVCVDNKPVCKAGLKLKPNQYVSLVFPQVKSTPAQPIDFDIDILFEDDDILVINKPSGLTVHPAPSVKEPTLVDWLKLHNISLSTLSGEERHGIVHRLDRGTSGVMVVAKNNAAHEALSLQLQDKTMGRYYLAVVSPPLKDDLIAIDKPIGRSAHNRLKMAISETGKSAKTMFHKLLLSHDETSELIVCKLFTGRTHQIRVHLESISRHILGDHLYGTSTKDGKIQHILLHAYRLYLIHPISGEALSFEAPLDETLSDYCTKNFNPKELHETLHQIHFEPLFSA